MAVTETIVFVHLKDGPAPAGRLTMTEEPRNSYATFAYGRRYLERPDRVPVDPVTLPLARPPRGPHLPDRRGVLPLQRRARRRPRRLGPVPHVQGDE